MHATTHPKTLTSIFPKWSITIFYILFTYSKWTNSDYQDRYVMGLLKAVISTAHKVLQDKKQGAHASFSTMLPVRGGRMELFLPFKVHDEPSFITENYTM